jgi:REP element-mobilizing transposase RayT
MPKRTDPIEIGKYYHLYNRGVNKQKIFFSDKNYSYFIFQLSSYFRGEADILAYCLMPNHFHIVIHVKSGNFLKKSLHPFLVKYSKAINKEQNRVGPLFQGRYQVNLIEDDGYLLECVKYIHLNPVRAEIVDLPVKWKYSSYSAYLSATHADFVETGPVMEYFETIKEFQEYTEYELVY